jgi:hypothetical protein
VQKKGATRLLKAAEDLLGEIEVLPFDILAEDEAEIHSLADAAPPHAA